ITCTPFASMAKQSAVMLWPATTLVWQPAASMLSELLRASPSAPKALWSTVFFNPACAAVASPSAKANTIIAGFMDPPEYGSTRLIVARKAPRSQVASVAGFTELFETDHARTRRIGEPLG